MRVFLDSNVLLSAMLSSGLCENLFQTLIKTKSIQSCSSQRVFTELLRLLPNKFKWSNEMTYSTLNQFAAQLILVSLASTPVAHCPDPDDAWILADALEANCNFFITGDKALLKMEHLHYTNSSSDLVSDSMRIVSPRAWLEIFDRQLNGLSKIVK